MLGNNSQENNGPGSLLRGGEFCSPVESRLCTEDVLLSELRSPARAKLRWHEHELAYVTVVLEGDYLEGDRGRLEDLCAFIAAFNPAVGCNNETVIGPSGASFFTIELRDQRRKELRLRGHAVARTSHVSGPQHADVRGAPGWKATCWNCWRRSRDSALERKLHPGG